MDLTQTIEPRSDQLNADDLMTGPRTVTITSVKEGSGPEQPVDVVTDEFGSGRPYKPCKSMRRVMVSAWGPDATQYVGRRMTLYRDPSVRFGRDEVGGIRISHMSGLSGPHRVALTVTRGKRAPFTVEPLDAPVTDQAAPGPAKEPVDVRPLVAAFTDKGITGPSAMLDYCRTAIGRDLDSARDLTQAETEQVITALNTAE